MAKSKFYVVLKGRTPGIYKTWDECKRQVHEFDKAVYKSFESEEEAGLAFKNGYFPTSKNPNEPFLKDPFYKVNTLSNEIIWESISVDAACAGNPGQMEYQGVNTQTKEQIFHIGPMYGTNNIGEFLALVHALALLKKNDAPHLPIYSDSKTAISWIKNKAIKTTLERNKKSERVFVLIDRALLWLQNNTFANPIYKWETEEWGEIPADFGRKG